VRAPHGSTLPATPARSAHPPHLPLLSAPTLRNSPHCAGCGIERSGLGYACVELGTGEYICDPGLLLPLSSGWQQQVGRSARVAAWPSRCHLMAVVCTLEHVQERLCSAAQQPPGQPRRRQRQRCRWSRGAAGLAPLRPRGRGGGPPQPARSPGRRRAMPPQQRMRGTALRRRWGRPAQALAACCRPGAGREPHAREAGHPANRWLPGARRCAGAGRAAGRRGARGGGGGGADRARGAQHVCSLHRPPRRLLLQQAPVTRGPCLQLGQLSRGAAVPPPTRTRFPGAGRALCGACRGCDGHH
jgi:hypothetical protein